MTSTRVLAGFFLAILAALVFSGCARGPALSDDYSTFRPAPGTGQVEIPEPTRLSDNEWSSMTEALGAQRGEIVPVEDKRWADVVVYFAYDSASIGPAERPKLVTLSEHLSNHAQYAVVVEGHCDERGSDEYNRALGESRALAVRDYLVSLGISPGRIETVSYGEERPVIADAATEAQHLKNRRAEFVIGVRR